MTTTTTGKRPTGTLHTADGVVTATKGGLFGAFSSGARVGLWHHRSGGYVFGHIQQIRLESGYTPPEGPRHFLVTILVSEGDAWLHDLDGRMVEVYVRADD